MHPLVWMVLGREMDAARRIKAAAEQGLKRIGLYLPESGALEPLKSVLPRWMEAVQKQGMALGMLSLPLPAAREEQTGAEEWLSWASGAGVQAVVLRPGIPDGEFLDIQAASSAAALCDQARGRGISLLVETSGPLSSCKRMEDFLTCVGREELKAAWNVHSTFLHEPMHHRPDWVVSRLGDRIALAVVRDSLFKAGVNRFCLLGFGHTPVLCSLQALRDAGITADLSGWIDCPPELAPDEAAKHCVRYFDMLQKLV